MPLRLIERLNATRQRYFVGRDLECEQFRSAVLATELPFSILYVFGSGGLGKTTLLWQFAQICQAADISVAYLDGRTIDPMPSAFLGAFQAATQDTLHSSQQRRVLLIDSYERLAALEGWLRQEFLPELPEQTLVVLAGRHAPESCWQADLGWKDLVCPVALKPLTAAESGLYLQARSLPLSQHSEIFNFTKGHPLALSLIADVYLKYGVVNIPPDATSHVIQTLLEIFLEEVPSLTHRLALEACAMVPTTTESLLAELLQLETAHELFEGLRGLSFVEVGAAGLVPQAIVREVVVSDLRWRNPERWAMLHHRAQTYYSNQLEQPFVLSQAEFLQALRDAFRNFARPDALQENPLLRSRLMLQFSDRGARVEALRSRLQTAAEVLRASPRDEKFYRTLYHTYLQPALTQEQAAELLDLPFSTYRRYLKTGIARVAEILWQQEILGG